MKKNFYKLSVVLLANLLLISSPVSHAVDSSHLGSKIVAWFEYRRFTNNLDFSDYVYPVELFIKLDASFSYKHYLF